MKIISSTKCVEQSIYMFIFFQEIINYIYIFFVLKKLYLTLYLGDLKRTKSQKDPPAFQQDLNEKAVISYILSLFLFFGSIYIPYIFGLITKQELGNLSSGLTQLASCAMLAQNSATSILFFVLSNADLPLNKLS